MEICTKRLCTGSSSWKFKTRELTLRHRIVPYGHLQSETMKKIRLILVGFLLLASATQAADVRTVKNLNFGWKFHAGDLQGAETVSFNDKGWQEINVPHDYQISQPWVPPAKDERPDNSDNASNIKSRLSSRGFKEMGIGWYRKVITPDKAWEGKRVLLDFEGIMLVGDVYLNGQRIGGTEYGYLGFEVDVTKLLKYGQPNILAVKANTQKPENSRWYTGGGLYRDVRLIVTDKNQFFVRNPLYITTPVVTDGKASVKIQAEMACYLRVPNLKVNTKIIDATGKTIYDQTKEVPFNRGQKINEYSVDSLTLSNPNLWSCENPYLYKAVLTLYRPDGTIADQASDHFGVRTIEYSPKFGFKLNGKKVLFKGIANHHTLGALGAAAYPRAMEKRIQLLKEYGFNHIRTSHNPYSKSFLDLCDKYGMLVVDELYDKWLTKFAGGRTPWTNLWQEHIPEFIRRDRNHPSVVMWSLGNELQLYWDLPFADWGVTPYHLQKVLLKRYDKTRPVTVAMHPRGRNLKTDSLPAPLALETDIASYNYRYMYFPGDSKRFPWMIFYQSEANNNMMGPNFYEMDLNKVVGLAYWGMIDYLGESNGWPAKGWPNGVFDLSLEPKPKAYLLKSMFLPKTPVVHIGIVDSEDNTVWNNVKVGTKGLSDHWNRKPGSTLSLYTYTNADEVELILNGKSLGKEKNNRQNPKVRNQVYWKNVKYEPGYLEAVAYTNGKVVARHRIETTGEAVKLKAQADNAAWKADGMDLQHMRITAVDKKGRVVQLADQQVTFNVEGPASIVGVINGDINSNELTVGNTRSLFKGTATVILRADQKPGKVTLTATANGLKKVKLVLESK